MIQVIETTEPAEASLSARIEELERQRQDAAQWHQEALRTAQGHRDAMLKLEGAIEELKRLRSEIWGGKEDARE